MQTWNPNFLNDKSLLFHDLLSMEIMISRNMTFDNTTYDQLAEMTADVLAQVVAAEEEVRVAIVEEELR